MAFTIARCGPSLVMLLTHLKVPAPRPIVHRRRQSLSQGRPSAIAEWEPNRRQFSVFN